ncbi:MAG: LuxR C-terminal-related transcriptional regulator [Pseudonocardia sp.]
MAGTWPLVGRREELTLLAAALTDDRTRGVVLSGAAGVGKTRLATELVERAASAHGRATAWASGNRSFGDIPFGAFAHLLPGSDVATIGPLDVMRRARAELVRRSGGRPLLLGVDDAHLLDEASAGLVHQLVASGAAFVVVTVRAGEPAPTSIRGLWRDELAERFELRPLTWHQVGELLAEALGGQLDTSTAHRMWEASAGNVLLLRELVLLGSASGRLAQRHGVWSWQGPLAVEARLVELIDDRLAGLPAQPRAAMELLAVGEPLPTAVFEGLVGADVACALEAAALLVADGPAGTARVAHPLYAETLRAQLRPLRHRSLCRALAAANAGDSLRVAMWQLDGGGEADPATLTDAARRAVWLYDHPLAERLARAAVAAGGGPAAALVLAETLQAQGKAADCREVLTELDPRDLDAELVAPWAVVASNNAFFGHGDVDGACAILVEAQAAAPSDDDRVVLLAHHGYILYFSGRLADALGVAEQALDRSGVGLKSRLLLGRSAILTLSATGATDRAIAIADELLRSASSAELEQSMLVDRLRLTRLAAYWYGGRCPEMEASASAQYEAMVAAQAHDLRGTMAGLLGRALFGQGRMASARSRLRESVALLTAQDVVGALPFFQTMLARAAAHLGDQVEATAMLAAARRSFNPAVRVAATELLLAQAWVAAGAGEISTARDRAREAADRAAEAGSPTRELDALHDAVRFGEPGLAPRLAEVSARIDHAVGPVCAAHAAALAADDGAALEGCAERFAGHGTLLLAAEAAVEAAEAHARAGRRAAELSALDRARRWAERCEGARTPVLARAGQSPTAAWLTAREREVAALAVQGLSNAEIAQRLVLSRRTVANHLNNAYGKLGISRRADLTAHLT